MRPILSGQFIYQLSVSMRKCYMEKKKKKGCQGHFKRRKCSFSAYSAFVMQDMGLLRALLSNAECWRGPRETVS